MIPQTTTNETTFWLTYNRDAIIPIKVGELSTRRLLFQEQHNKENMRVELETKDDVQEISKIKEEETKLRASRRYNTKVQLGAFQSGNLVSRVWGEARKDP